MADNSFSFPTFRTPCKDTIEFYFLKILVPLTLISINIVVGDVSHQSISFYEHFPGKILLMIGKIRVLVCPW